MRTSVYELMQSSANEPVPAQTTPAQQQVMSNRSNPNSFIDVHQFDYTYQDKTYDHIDENVTTLTDHEKQQWINQLRLRMHNPVAIQGVGMIEANIGMPANEDRTNQKRAEDILVVLAKYVLQCDHSFLLLIEEQLEDMVHLGQCAQGRTTRLWQLFTSLPKNEKLK